MVIKTVYHFIDSNHGVEISSKRQRLTEKRERRAGKGERWEVLEVFCLGAGQMTYFGKGRVCLGARGRMKLYKITIK